MAQWLDPQAPMLVRSLKNVGYTTGHFGKWHMGGQRDVTDAPRITEYGFDESLTNFEGRVQRFCKAKPALGDAMPVMELLARIAKGLCHDLGHPQKLIISPPIYIQTDLSSIQRMVPRFLIIPKTAS